MLMQGELDDLGAVINIQYAGVAVQEVHFYARGDYATKTKSDITAVCGKGISYA